MFYSVVSVFDMALNAYGRPYVAPTPEAAIRSFTMECRRVADDNPLYTSPEDFRLFMVATWNEDTGKFENLSPPTMLLRAKDVEPRKGA